MDESISTEIRYGLNNSVGIQLKKLKWYTVQILTKNILFIYVCVLMNVKFTINDNVENSFIWIN